MVLARVSCSCCFLLGLGRCVVVGMSTYTYTWERIEGSCVANRLGGKREFGRVVIHGRLGKLEPQSGSGLGKRVHKVKI